MNISRERDSTKSLGSLFHCCHPQSKDIFVMLICNFLCSSPCPLSFVLSLDTTKKSLEALESPLDTHPLDICKIPSQSSLLHAEQFQISHPFLIREMIEALNHLCGLPLDSVQTFLLFLEQYNTII